MYIITAMKNAGFEVDSNGLPGEKIKAISFYNSVKDIFAQMRMENADSKDFPFTLEFYHYPEAHKKVRIDYHFCRDEASVMNSIESLFSWLRDSKKLNSQEEPETIPVEKPKNYLEYSYNLSKGSVFALFPNKAGNKLPVYDFIKLNIRDRADLLSNVHMVEIVESFDSLKEAKGVLYTDIIFPETTSKNLALAQKERAEKFLFAIMDHVERILSNPDLVTADFVRELNENI